MARLAGCSCIKKDKVGLKRKMFKASQYDLPGKSVKFRFLMKGVHQQISPTQSKKRTIGLARERIEDPNTNLLKC